MRKEDREKLSNFVKKNNPSYPDLIRFIDSLKRQEFNDCIQSPEGCNDEPTVIDYEPLEKRIMAQAGEPRQDTPLVKSPFIGGTITGRIKCDLPHTQAYTQRINECFIGERLPGTTKLPDNLLYGSSSKSALSKSLSTMLKEVKELVTEQTREAYFNGMEEQKNILICWMKSKRNTLNYERGGSPCSKPYLQGHNHKIDLLDELLNVFKK